MSNQIPGRVKPCQESAVFPVVRKLTAITVILMIPTLIASHFGMNFTNMPELDVAWAYPTVIAFQVILVGVGIYLFRRIGWL